MRVIAGILALAAAASAMTLNHERIFGDWKRQFGRAYGTTGETELSGFRPRAYRMAPSSTNPPRPARGACGLPSRVCGSSATPPVPSGRPGRAETGGRGLRRSASRR